MQYVIFNGNLLEKKDVHISIDDRGFRYGDGIFDTAIISNGKIYKLAWHLDRIKRSLQAVRIEFNTDNLAKLCSDLIKANNVKNGLLRVQITRGSGGRGYLPEKDISPTLIIETLPQPVIEQKPVSLWLGSYQKISASALPTQFKLCQGLNSTLARMEAADNSCFDALLLNDKNHICETSSANIFWVRNDELYTPSLACGAVEGSIRNSVINLWQGKIYEVEADIEELRNADEVFITNVAWKIIPVFNLQPTDIKWQNHKTSSQILEMLERDIAVL